MGEEKNKLGSQRDDLAIESTCCSCGETGLDSKYLPNSGLPPPTIPVPGDLTCSSDLHGHQVCM